MKEILIALISGGFSLAGVIITVIATQKKAMEQQRAANAHVISELKSRSDASDAKLDKEVALLRAEVDELMREVRQHNNFAQRMPVVENDIKNMKDQIAELKKERGA